jgi:hypothetical protein
VQTLKTNRTNNWRIFEIARPTAKVNLKAIGCWLPSAALAAAIGAGVVEAAGLRLPREVQRVGASMHSRACERVALLLVAYSDPSRTALESKEGSC